MVSKKGSDNMSEYEFVRDENGNGWIANHTNGLMYPMFYHPEVNESTSEEELKKVCDEMDKSKRR